MTLVTENIMINIVDKDTRDALANIIYHDEGIIKLVLPDGDLLLDENAIDELHKTLTHAFKELMK